MSLLRFPFPIFRQWLLAPAVGLSTVLLLVTIFNQAGIPVGRFGFILAIALFAMGWFAFVRRRPIFPWRQLGLFFAVALCALFYTGWPALRFGFNWVSFGNDDMANYCLSAFRYLHNGFYRVPTVAELSGTDYSQYLWFLEVRQFMRFGSDILLAWVSSISGLAPLKAFMPTILAFGLVQLFSLAGLVAVSSRRRKLALVSMTLLAISPLYSFGILYQLIAQIAGLAVLLAAFAVLAGPVPWRGWKRSFGYPMIAGGLCASLALLYPEITPFGILAIGLLAGIRMLLHKEPPARFAFSLGSSLLFAVVCLRSNVLMYLNTLLAQTTTGMNSGKRAFVANAFPYFLSLMGLPNLFGFQAIARVPGEPYVMISVVLAGVAFLIAGTIAIRRCLKAEPFAALLTVMLGMTLLLFVQRNGFGMFKIAMFIQPVLMTAIACLFVRSRTMKTAGAVGVFLILTFQSQLVYEHASLGTGASASFSELPMASEAAMNAPKTSGYDRAICDTNNLVSTKLLGILLHGFEFTTPATNWGLVFCHRAFPVAATHKLLPTFVSPMEGDAEKLEQRLVEDIYSRQTLWNSEFILSSHDTNEFQKHSLLIAGPGKFSSINRLRESLLSPFDSSAGYYRSHDCDHLKNWLIFTNSSRGANYYQFSDAPISNFKSERDVMDLSNRFSGMGRFHLFRIINPTDTIQLRISMTDSIMGHGRTELPANARVLGENEAALHFTGCGCACVLSEPVKPKLFRGAYYIAVDFGSDGLFFENKAKGTVALFRKELSSDHRQLVGFLRDISALSPDECEHWERPREIKKFPEDLLHQNGLVFSGIYEDGWISNRAVFSLGAAKPGESVVIKGTVPRIGEFATHPNVLRAWVAGEAAQEMEIPGGAFSVTLPIVASGKDVELHVEFQKTIALGSPDDRPAAAQIESIRLENSPH